MAFEKEKRLLIRTLISFRKKSWKLRAKILDLPGIKHYKKKIRHLFRSLQKTLILKFKDGQLE